MKKNQEGRLVNLKNKNKNNNNETTVTTTTTTTFAGQLAQHSAAQNQCNLV